MFNWRSSKIQWRWAGIWFFFINTAQLQDEFRTDFQSNVSTYEITWSLFTNKSTNISCHDSVLTAMVAKAMKWLKNLWKLQWDLINQKNQPPRMILMFQSKIFQVLKRNKRVQKNIYFSAELPNLWLLDPQQTVRKLFADMNTRQHLTSWGKSIRLKNNSWTDIELRTGSNGEGVRKTVDYHHTIC